MSVRQKDRAILEDLRAVNAALESADSRFDNACGEELVESVIYEIEALKAKRRYLLRLAREMELHSDDISSVWIRTGK